MAPQLVKAAYGITPEATQIIHTWAPNQSFTIDGSLGDLMHHFQKRRFRQYLRGPLPLSLSLPILALFAAAISSAAQAGIQQPAASAEQSAAPAATLRSDTSLVLVDVVVREKGDAVHGIGKQRFHVFEDGKEQPLVSVDEHGPASISPQALPPLPPNT